MYLIRDIFKAKPGKAKELVRRFKEAAPYFANTEGSTSMKIMTDIVAPYWTVVIQSEVEDIGKFISGLRSATAPPEVAEIMKGYMDLVNEGYREVFLIE
jgi:heme-degrading monooxygenase HmoA